MLKLVKIFLVVFAFSSTVAYADYVGTAFPECYPNTFNVSYSANGGSGVAPSTPISCKYGEECLAPENTYSKTDNKFSHWVCTTVGGSECASSVYYVGDDISRATQINDETITLAASWVSADTHTIHYSTYGGVLASDVANRKSSCTETSEKIVLPTADEITRPNSAFVSWTNDDNEIVTEILPGECISDLQFYANWNCNTGYAENNDKTACDAIAYKITYHLNGGIANTANPSTYKITDSDILFAAPSRANSKFDGWFAENTFVNAKTQILSGSTGDQVVYAKWSCNDGYYLSADGQSCVGNTITISYNENGGSDVANMTCTYGDTFTIASDIARTGYTFAGWKLADGTTVAAGSKVDCNNTKLGVFSGTTESIVAQWTANEYEVIYSCNTDGQSSAPAANSATYDSEYTVASNTCEKVGHNFGGWLISGTETVIGSGDTFTWKYTSGKTLTAQWTVASYKCGSGTYLPAGATSCVECISGSYCSGGTYSYNKGATQGITGCGANTYSDAGASTCTPCASGYTNSEEHSGIDSCKITCGAGEYVAQAGNGCVSVGDGYYGSGGTVGQGSTLSRNECPSGYREGSAASSESECVGSCSVSCSGKASCPANSSSCSHDTSVSSRGTWTYGEQECSAELVVCPVKDFTCSSGYRKTADGKSCERADYRIIYNLGGGTNYAGAPQQYVAGIGSTIDGTPTYYGHVFVAWCLDASQTECNDRVVISESAIGDVYVWAKWSVCPSGYYCDSAQRQCPSSHPDSASGSDSISDCYKVCEPREENDAIVNPIADKAYYAKECVYGTDAVCRPGTEKINGVCVACNRENALTYTQGCVVDSCVSGYHPNGDSCASNRIVCGIDNAMSAYREWDSDTKRYGACTISECKEGYHIAANTCVSDTEVCDVRNGIGIREWDSFSNKWGECVATSCDPGYTNDSGLTNESWEQCGRCANANGAYGEQVVSSYVRGCEIATCMYQGERYALENNECHLICDEYSDETGRRYWDPSSKKCVHDCNAGYMKW